MNCKTCNTKVTGMYCPVCDKTLREQDVELTVQENIKAEIIRESITHRFGCWCATIEKTPTTALIRDEEGTALNLYEFSLWVQAMWQEWRQLNNIGFYDPLSDQDHRDFDKWLGEKTGLFAEENQDVR